MGVNTRLVVGITGGIGSGKSEVTRRFQTLGITVVDADELARTVVEPGQPALARIAEHLGEEYLQADGRLDRARLRTRIFSDPAAKHWLEQLLHPLINQQIRQQLAASTSPYTILVSPLLLETEQHRLVDRVLVVDAREAEQLARASARDQTSPERIQAIIDSQISRTERLARAQDVLDNQGSLAELDTRVEQLHQQYLALTQQPRDSH